jgi:hypothetical protein
MLDFDDVGWGKVKKCMYKESFLFLAFFGFGIFAIQLFSIALLDFGYFWRFAIRVFLLWFLPLLIRHLIVRFAFLLHFPFSFFHLFKSNSLLFDIAALIGPAIASGVAIILVENLFVFLILH